MVHHINPHVPIRRKNDRLLLWECRESWIRQDIWETFTPDFWQNIHNLWKYFFFFIDKQGYTLGEIIYYHYLINMWNRNLTHTNEIFFPIIRGKKCWVSNHMNHIKWNLFSYILILNMSFILISELHNTHTKLVP